MVPPPPTCAETHTAASTTGLVVSTSALDDSTMPGSAPALPSPSRRQRLRGVLADRSGVTESEGKPQPVGEEGEGEEGRRRHRFRNGLRDRVYAAEVAAEEAAGYGWATEAVEAAAAAVNPEHELGEDE